MERWRTSGGGQTEGKGFELGDAPGIREAEATAHLAITGGERGVLPHFQTRVTLKPGGIELPEQMGVARTEDQLQVFAFRQKLVECLAADSFDDFRSRFESGHEAAGEIEGEVRQGGADLTDQNRLEVGELGEDPILQMLHVGPNVDQLPVGERLRGILTLAEGFPPEGLDLGVR